jgi:hypothetical protein
VVVRGLVYLYGPVARSDDLFEMAQVVAELRGVERVVVKEVRTPAGR